MAHGARRWYEHFLFENHRGAAPIMRDLTQQDCFDWTVFYGRIAALSL
jgi:hypothetical protein